MLIKWKPSEVFEKFSKWLERQDQEKEIICHFSAKNTKEIRTLTQNSMLHWLFTEIGNHIWEDMEETKNNFMKWVFWVKEVRIGKFVSQEAIKPHTSELSKEEWIFLIDCIMKFIDSHWVPCKYTPRDLQNLYNTYQ